MSLDVEFLPFDQPGPSTWLIHIPMFTEATPSGALWWLGIGITRLRLAYRLDRIGD